jgi:hypothetical protein
MNVNPQRHPQTNATDSTTIRTEIRFDAPVRATEAYPESIYLRLWAASQAAGYENLLRTIAFAPRPVRRDG